MVLNIFPRRRETATTTESIAPEQSLPEPSTEALDGLPKRPTRRGTRGGRGRSRGGAATEAVVVEETEAAAAANQPEPDTGPARAPRARRPRAGAAAPKPEPDVAAEAAEVSEPVEALAPAEPRPPRGRRGVAPARPPAVIEGDTGSIVRALEHQGRQLEQLARGQEELVRKIGSGTAGAAAPPARVGIFVDAANVELASDRMRARIDWAKVLKLLTKDRQLVRAIAYCPVYDDPNVSIETQRFVEPFLDKGYKVVTKPLKRFQDGTIKANLDIELALDIITMLDRLDIVCLVSGDGDFQRLVEVLQSRGVRVEVVAAGPSTAANLRHAADEFIDVQARIKDIRV